MGLFSNILKDAVSSGTKKVTNSVTTGIANGVGKAVSNAAEKAVAPAANKLANDTAQKINETGASMNAAADAANASLNQAAAAAPQTAQNAQAAGSGFAALAGSLSGLMSAAESMATDAAANIKICPKCGSGAPSNQKFCSKCGTPLPEKTLGADYVCPNCGKQNAPGASFCAGCGTRLAGAAAAPAKASQPTEDGLAAADKIRKVLGESFPQYEVREKVSPATLGGSGKFMDYSFGVYAGGAPRLFIMLVGKTTCTTRLYRWSKEQAEKSGVAMINFVEHFPNDPAYIKDRLQKYL